MTLKPLATNFGTDESQARTDAFRLSAALGQPLLFWLEDGIWWVLGAALAVGKDLGFPHELISYK